MYGAGVDAVLWGMLIGGLLVIAGALGTFLLVVYVLGESEDKSCIFESCSCVDSSHCGQ